MKLDKDSIRTLKVGDKVDIVCMWYNGLATVTRTRINLDDDFVLNVEGDIDHQAIGLMSSWLGNTSGWFTSISVIGRDPDTISIETISKRDLRLQEEAYYQEVINS